MHVQVATIFTQDNTISISESDFEEFENAFLRDPSDKRYKPFSTQNSDREKRDDNKNEYSRGTPEYQQSEKTLGPSVLSPPLLQVILNKNTPVSMMPRS